MTGWLAAVVAALEVVKELLGIRSEKKAEQKADETKADAVVNKLPDPTPPKE